MSIINIQEKTKSAVMDALLQINGQNLSFKDQSDYANKIMYNKNAQNKVRSDLTIKEVMCFGTATEETQESQLLKYAVQKLKSFGFHESHCSEALEHSDSNVQKAFLSLYKIYMKYDPVQLPNGDMKSYQEILNDREDEKMALSSILLQDFVEKEPNKLWLINLNLDYLLEFYKIKTKKSESAKSKIDANKEKSSKDRKKQEICKNFLKGHCKFGNKCWYKHEEEEEVKTNRWDSCNESEKKAVFTLEIHLTDDCKYPCELPIILLRTNIDSLKDKCFSISYQLLREASKNCIEQSLPCVFYIYEYLNDSNAVLDFLASTKFRIPDATVGLFSEHEDVPDTDLDPKTHFEKKFSYFNSTGSNLEERQQNDRRIVDKFLANPIELNKNLPACKMSNEIINKVKNNQIVLIFGDTGCGKSTQVPQIILNDWISNYANKTVNIICTQPRRLATIALAERVAAERDQVCGKLVGYQIRLEKKVSQYTRLTFCTNGILLRTLIGDPLLQEVTHLIIDEVHERSEETDFLLLLLKMMLKKRSDLKIILMSATFNQEKFASYFESISRIEIPGRTFPVTEIYLEDFVESEKYVLERDSVYAKKLKKGEFEFNELDSLAFLKTHELSAEPNTKPDEALTLVGFKHRYCRYSIQTIQTLYLMNESLVNLELIEFTIDFILSNKHSYPKTGTILVFLPGIAEIKQLYETFKSRYSFANNQSQVDVLPLHSSLSNEDQAKIFRKTKNRKVILSTNVAETSITIDDCVFVIDCGKMKEKHYDSSKNMESLKSTWISKANANQRKGRAGRVMAGVCFRLYTKPRFDYQFRSYPVAEILRIPLEPMILKIKTINLFFKQDLLSIFKRFIEPPNPKDIEAAIRRLELIGAMTSGKELTALGKHLSVLPVDVRVGKLMIFGAMFRCIDPILTIAACLSYKTPFHVPFNRKDQQVFLRKKKFQMAASDQLTTLNAYNKWLKEYKKNKSLAYEFANLNFLSSSTLQMLMEIKYQYLELLVDIDFVPVDLCPKKPKVDCVYEITGPEWNKNSSNVKLLTAIICAALYPNVAKISVPEVTYKQTISGAIPLDVVKTNLPLKTKDGVRAFFHHTSVNHLSNNLCSDYVLYHEKFETNKVYLHDTTLISALSLVLFSSDPIKIEVQNNKTVLLLNSKWIKLYPADHKTAELVVALRNELMQILELKLNDPLLNLLNHEVGKLVIQTVVDILTTE